MKKDYNKPEITIEEISMSSIMDVTNVYVDPEKKGPFDAKMYSPYDWDDDEDEEY